MTTGPKARRDSNDKDLCRQEQTQQTAISVYFNPNCSAFITDFNTNSNTKTEKQVDIKSAESLNQSCIIWDIFALAAKL